MTTRFFSLQYQTGVITALDQRKLPHRVEYRELREWEAVVMAIQDMTIRGAPLIGIAAAFGVVLAALSAPDNIALVRVASETLRASRPTAVNLMWALDRMNRVIDRSGAAVAPLLTEAESIFEEDKKINLSIAEHGLSILPSSARVIHHCNTGSLATADYGTALGIIRLAHERGMKIHAFLDETRPRFQGSALSAFELSVFGVPHTIMIDSAAAFLMNRRKIDACLVGCDRVVGNGDTANKIGTYALALMARAHNVPFYVACPSSSIDRKLQTGADIVIEERSEEEITTVGGVAIAPRESRAWNPAFDITPGELITGFITERGIFKPKDLQDIFT